MAPSEIIAFEHGKSFIDEAENDRAGGIEFQEGRDGPQHLLDPLERRPPGVGGPARQRSRDEDLVVDDRVDEFGRALLQIASKGDRFRYPPGKDQMAHPGVPIFTPAREAPHALIDQILGFLDLPCRVAGPHMFEMSDRPETLAFAYPLQIGDRVFPSTHFCERKAEIEFDQAIVRMPGEKRAQALLDLQPIAEERLKQQQRRASLNIVRVELQRAGGRRSGKRAQPRHVRPRARIP